MSDSPASRVFAVSGRDDEDPVSWLHVHADVQGVLEEDGCQVVWMACAMPELPGRFQVDVVERAVREQDLHVTGLENDTAIHVTEDLLVRPPRVGRPEGFAGVELLVPRGGAFGSGEHDSTKAALAVMHRGWSAPVSLADCGTGSGILALIAAVPATAGLRQTLGALTASRSLPQQPGDQDLR